ncbi:unnamed protein product [Mycena citricolor]|uniref:Uncharacterized protein n=1 Tax=Mycena citricolor TaxID=2018698 RepID=A0AAD2HHI7_9AGAR|nr:unnamed protein product [Mycena citricolor]
MDIGRKRAPSTGGPGSRKSGTLYIVEQSPKNPEPSESSDAQALFSSQILFSTPTAVSPVSSFQPQNADSSPHGVSIQSTMLSQLPFASHGAFPEKSACSQSKSKPEISPCAGTTAFSDMNSLEHNAAHSSAESAESFINGIALAESRKQISSSAMIGGGSYPTILECRTHQNQSTKKQTRTHWASSAVCSSHHASTSLTLPVRGISFNSAAQNASTNASASSLFIAGNSSPSPP